MDHVTFLRGILVRQRFSKTKKEEIKNCHAIQSSLKAFSFALKDSAEAFVELLSKKVGTDRTDHPEICQYSVAKAERSGALAVKTPG